MKTRFKFVARGDARARETENQSSRFAWVLVRWLSLLGVLAPAHAPAAPAANSGAARLFERAATIYGEARSLTLDYRVTSNRPDVPAAERGSIAWRKPDFYAQSWTYSGGSGHVAADAKQIYFTDVNGKTGRTNWKGEFGFWASLPWSLPGNSEFLLRGQKISMRGAILRALPPQTLEGVPCDGALLDLRAVNGDTIRFWFAHKSGLLMRETWAVRLPDSDQIAQVQTRYFNIRLNPKLKRADFVRPDEERAPVVAADNESDSLGLPRE